MNDEAMTLESTTNEAFGDTDPPAVDLRSLPRRERVRALMREEILQAARTLVQQEGIKGLTMRALGRAVGVTAPTLYDYFPSKEAVLDALFIQGTQLLTSAFDAAIEATEPGRERLRAVAIAYRRFAIEHPDLYLLIFGRVDASYRPGVVQLECAMNIGGRANQVVADAMRLGDIRAGDPGAVGNAIWAMAHGHITLELSGFCDKFGPDAGEEIYRRNFEILFQGLAPTQESGVGSQESEEVTAGWAAPSNP